MTSDQKKCSLCPEDEDIVQQRSSGFSQNPEEHGPSEDTLRRQLHRLSAKHYNRKVRALQRLESSYPDLNNLCESEAKMVVSRKHRLWYEAEKLELIRQSGKGLESSTSF
jgi:hypothetical protein